MRITNADKLACVEREVKMRRRVYPNWVKAGKLGKGEADYQIAVMEAIADDYREPDLFEKEGRL